LMPKNWVTPSPCRPWISPSDEWISFAAIRLRACFAG
jgi:hypothetical protein